MREQREPWLTLPEKEPGGDETPRVDPRFRTHVVTDRTAGAAPPSLPSQIPVRSRPEPPARQPVSPLQVRAAPTVSPDERGAAIVRLRPAAPSPVPPRAEPAPPVIPQPAQTHAPGAAEIGLDDLADVSSADWLAKVGEAARVVDVVVVFYSEAALGSAMFQRAFRTVVNEMLPQLGRPYAIYRFALDAEPEFVADMAESLGLVESDPITTMGFAWSGPGRRLFLIGNRALESPAAFQRALRQNLRGERAPLVGESGGRRASAIYARTPIWGGRVFVILGWCLFGTAAVAAAVVGLAPHWASSLLHPASFPGSGAAVDAVPSSVNAQGAIVPSPAVVPDVAPAAPLAAEGVLDPTKHAKPVKHVKRRQMSSGPSSNLGYWGLPEKAAH